MIDRVVAGIASLIDSIVDFFCFFFNNSFFYSHFLPMNEIENRSSVTSFFFGCTSIDFTGFYLVFFLLRFQYFCNICDSLMSSYS